MSVNPKSLRANGLYMPWGKKWTITCGHCQHVWRERIPVANTASAYCPGCRTQNRWSVAEWRQVYEAAKAGRQ